MEYHDEDTTEEEFKIIAETEEKLKEKIVSYAHVSLKFDRAGEAILAEAQALEEQAKKMKSRAGVFANRSQRLRDAMENALLNHNLKKIETPLFTISLRKKPKRVIELATASLEKLSERFIRISKSFDKKAIGDALKEGETVEGFVLSEDEFTLSIR